jgi:hypothetical protein
MSRLYDPTPAGSPYEGDLRYGRAFGTTPDKHRDFHAERVDGTPRNVPVVPLVLVQPRDPQVWKKDARIKEMKKSVDNSQHGVNYVLQAYQSQLNHMKSNLHLTVGKQRL